MLRQINFLKYRGIFYIFKICAHFSNHSQSLINRARTYKIVWAASSSAPAICWCLQKFHRLRTFRFDVDKLTINKMFSIMASVARVRQGCKLPISYCVCFISRSLYYKQYDSCNANIFCESHDMSSVPFSFSLSQSLCLSCCVAWALKGSNITVKSSHRRLISDRRHIPTVFSVESISTSLCSCSSLPIPHLIVFYLFNFHHVFVVFPRGACVVFAFLQPRTC